MKETRSAKIGKIGQGKNGTALLAGRFILSIAILFAAFSFLFSLIPLIWVESFYAQGTLFLLQFIGFKGEVFEAGDAFLNLQGFGLPLGFTYLCTGMLEMALIWAAVLSTWEIGLKKRLAGLAFGAVAIVVFNFVRVVASIIIIHYIGLGQGEFSHDILFRIFLLVTIAGYYYYWLKWASGLNSFK